MGIIDGDQHAGQFTLNPPLVIPVLNEGLLFCPDEVEGDCLPTCTVEVLRAPTWLAFDCVDVRKVGSFSVLANDPEARGTPLGPGIQSPFEVADLTVALGRLSNFVQDGVIPIDERHKVCMVAWVGDALPILVPVQQSLVMLQCTLLGTESPGADLDSLCNPSSFSSFVSAAVRIPTWQPRLARTGRVADHSNPVKRTCIPCPRHNGIGFSAPGSKISSTLANATQAK